MRHKPRSEKSKIAEIGYSQAGKESNIEVATGGGKVNVWELELLSLTALGNTKERFPVLAVPIPEEATFDGVIGKDFFRGRILTIDFRNGTIDLQ